MAHGPCPAAGHEGSWQGQACMGMEPARYLNTMITLRKYCQDVSQKPKRHIDDALEQRDLLLTVFDVFDCATDQARNTTAVLDSISLRFRRLSGIGSRPTAQTTADCVTT